MVEHIHIHTKNTIVLCLVMPYAAAKNVLYRLVWLLVTAKVRLPKKNESPLVGGKSDIAEVVKVETICNSSANFQ